MVSQHFGTLRVDNPRHLQNPQDSLCNAESKVASHDGWVRLSTQLLYCKPNEEKNTQLGGELTLAGWRGNGKRILQQLAKDQEEVDWLEMDILLQTEELSTRIQKIYQVRRFMKMSDDQVASQAASREAQR